MGFGKLISYFQINKKGRDIMKERKGFVVLLAIMFFVCLIPIVNVVTAAEPLKKIEEFGFFFKFSVAYIMLFVSSILVKMSENI
jgi:hypothetical protein